MLILALSVVVVIVDQVTKLLIWQSLPLGRQVVIIPGLFSLRYVQNTGAAWGILSGFSHWLVLMSVVILALLLILRRHFMADTLLHRIATGLMIAGIIGNLIDRVRLGYVVDFLDFYWRQSHFPAFNVADSAICIGVGIYIVSQWFVPEESAPGDGVSVGPQQGTVSPAREAGEAG
jgi:signal peptidase II